MSSNVEIKRSRKLPIKEASEGELWFGERYVGHCVLFRGRGEYPAWIDLEYDPWPRESGVEVELFSQLANIVGEGGRIMVSYLRDRETYTLLRYGVPPQLTPLGFSQLRAGFSWFKDWYFPEGGNEGGVKLQGNLPLNHLERKRQLKERAEELRGYEHIPLYKVVLEYLRERIAEG